MREREKKNVYLRQQNLKYATVTWLEHRVRRYCSERSALGITRPRNENKMNDFAAGNGDGDERTCETLMHAVYVPACTLQAFSKVFIAVSLKQICRQVHRKWNGVSVMAKKRTLLPFDCRRFGAPRTTRTSFTVNRARDFHRIVSHLTAPSLASINIRPFPLYTLPGVNTI